MSEATYFTVTDVGDLGWDDGLQFCEALPERAGVVAIPCQGFHDDQDAGRHLIRWAFCKDRAVLEEGLRRLAKADLRRVGQATGEPCQPPVGAPPLRRLYQSLAPPANRQTMVVTAATTMSSGISAGAASWAPTSESAMNSATTTDETTRAIRAPLERRMAKIARTIAPIAQSARIAIDHGDDAHDLAEGHALEAGLVLELGGHHVLGDEDADEAEREQHQRQPREDDRDDAGRGHGAGPAVRDSAVLPVGRLAVARLRVRRLAVGLLRVAGCCSYAGGCWP